MLKQQAAADRWHAAICASPAVVLETKGLLKGKKATAHPAFTDKLTDQRCVPDGSSLAHTQQAAGVLIIQNQEADQRAISTPQSAGLLADGAVLLSRDLQHPAVAASVCWPADNVLLGCAVLQSSEWLLMAS